MRWPLQETEKTANSTATTTVRFLNNNTNKIKLSQGTVSVLFAFLLSALEHCFSVKRNRSSIVTLRNIRKRIEGT